MNGIHEEGYPANWDRDGKSAGRMRNVHMLRSGKPDGVVAFPGGDGTAHMIAIAERARVPVWQPKRTA
jgi:hypothetical protein